jgi:hypothetical protein
MDRERTDRGPETLPFRSPMPRSDHVLSDVISSRFRGLLKELCKRATRVRTLVLVGGMRGTPRSHLEPVCAWILDGVEGRIGVAAEMRCGASRGNSVSNRERYREAPSLSLRLRSVQSVRERRMPLAPSRTEFESARIASHPHSKRHE